MPAVQRKGDKNRAGGVVLGGISSVLVNGRAIGVSGLSVTPHPPCNPKEPKSIAHCKAKTRALGRGKVYVEGKAVLVTGDRDSCNHSRAGGSPDVRVG